jgi:rubrerythrin
MSDKPSYLGLLNAIAVGEARGYALLDAWAKTTSDESLAGVLRTVAIRENEHAAAFTKRLCELGYGVREAARGDFDRKLEKARSRASDREKFESILGYGRGEQTTDPLADLFKDKSIDIQTGELLGRFIAEERDSERRLRQAYAKLERGPDDDALAEIHARLERLTATIEELKALRRP